MTQCNHLGLGGLLELVEAEFEDKEDEVVVVVLEAMEAVEATDPEVKPERRKQIGIKSVFLLFLQKLEKQKSVSSSFEFQCAHKVIVIYSF